MENLDCRNKRILITDNNGDLKSDTKEKKRKCSAGKSNMLINEKSYSEYWNEDGNLDGTPGNDAQSHKKGMCNEKTITSCVTGMCTPNTPGGFRISMDQFEFSPTKTSLERIDSFDLLSDEIILMIFKKVDKRALLNCARVCQRWRSIAYDNDLWTRIDISCRKIMLDSMVHILLRNPIILRMAQTEVASPMFDELSCLMDNFSAKLEYLDLSIATINNKDLSLLLSKCSRLLKLSLESCKVNADVCYQISKNRNLTVLNMASCSNVDNDGLCKILSHCKRLEELNIAWINLNNETINSVCQLLTENIRKLNISGCGKEMQDDHVAILASRCTKLKELDLSDSTAITEGSIEYLTNGLDYLEHLSLSRCYAIRPSKYLTLFIKSSLRYLNIFGLFPDRNIETLQRSTSNIQLNKFKFSGIARPTIGVRRTSIWGLNVKNS